MQNFPHCADSGWDPYSVFLHRTGIRFQVRTRIQIQQCVQAIKRYGNDIRFVLLQCYAVS